MSNNLEQEKINREQKLISEIVGHEGWPLIREKFLQKMSSMANIMGITDANPATIIQVLGARQLTTTALSELLKDIEGTVEQYDINVNLKQDLSKGYILRTDL